MLQAVGDVNWIGAVLGAVAYFMLGAVWFGPLFGKAYDRALGFQRTSNQKWPVLYYVGPLASSVVVALATAILLGAVRAASYGDALALAAVVGIGYSVPVSVNNAINPKTPRPLLYGAVTGIYHLVGAMVVAVIAYALG